MDNLIESKITNVLKSTAESILEDTKENADVRLERMNTIMNLQKIVNNYDELEPLLNKFFAEKARKDKWKQK